MLVLISATRVQFKMIKNKDRRKMSFIANKHDGYISASL
jgi:hypothetical protein